jgi:glycosyltransferase involved in cell wall biosynthesis
MRILALSFYYEPDLSAGSFRCTSLVAALRQRMPPGTQIDVITTLPNRYHGFSREAPELETSAGLEIRRISLPTHRSDVAGQSRAFLQFARQALRQVAGRDYDLVFATSSRLMTAALGALIARRKRAYLYLDIRDIFVETIGEIWPGPLSWPISRACSLLESWTLRRADRINLVSRGFEEYFRERYPDRALSWFTNGIDDEFLTSVPAPAADGRRDARPATVVYAGNIGEGQGLHGVVPGLAVALQARARFVVIGDGGRREALVRAVTRAGADNVELRAPMHRRELLEAYRTADVLFLHLGAHAAFERVLPSKLFEYAALGKPILAGVAGYAARFIRAEIGNAAVFAPCDVAGAVAAFQSLELVDRPRPAFTAKYVRSNISRAMADDVLALLPGGPRHASW